MRTRTKPVTIANLTDIHTIPAYISHPYPKENQTMVLHIVNQSGNHGNHPTHVTKCNRVADYWEFATNHGVKILAAQNPEREDIKFCARCGTKDDFEKVVELWRSSVNKEEERRKEEDAERQKRYAALKERITLIAHANAQDLTAAGLKVKPGADYHEYYYIRNMYGKKYKFVITIEEL